MFFIQIIIDKTSASYEWLNFSTRKFEIFSRVYFQNVFDYFTTFCRCIFSPLSLYECRKVAVDNDDDLTLDGIVGYPALLDRNNCCIDPPLPLLGGFIEKLFDANEMGLLPIVS